MGLVPTVMRWFPDRGRRGDVSARQIYIDPTSVFLGCEVEAHLVADLLDTGLELLHAARRVVALAHNDVQVRLPTCTGIPDARLEDVLGLFDELPMQVDGVGRHAARRVILAEDELGRLPVVGLLLSLVPLTFLG